MIKVFLVFVCVFLPIKGVAMSMFSENEQEVILFSPMAGKITFKGEPASGAKIIRLVKWKDDKGESDTVIANEKGEFILPIKIDHFKINPIFQLVIAQEIRVLFQGNEFLIWARTKRDINEYTELNGKPTNFRCELTKEFMPVQMEDGLFGTSCEWDSLEKQGE